jgi:cytochrome c
MKASFSLHALVAAAAALVLSLPAAAAPDAAAAEKLMKSSGCSKCHAVDKSKKGPAFQKVAAKYKGQADAEAKLVGFLSKPTKVKFADGTQEDHDIVDTKDAAQVKNLVQWVLAQ